MLSAAGIGSGLDVDSIVAQLMALERRPLDKLQEQKEQIDARISAYGNLQSALSTFQDAMQQLSSPAALRIFNTTSGNDSVFTAQASETAAASSFGIEVIRLAERHKFASGEESETYTVGGQNPNDALEIQVGSDPANTLTVDLSTAMTFGEIRDAINTAANNPGVTASLVFGNDGNQKLVITAAESGSANELGFSYPGRVRASDFGFEEVSNSGGDPSLLDAEISVDGYNITRGNNTIDDVITGVTLDLHAADPGFVYALDIGRDTASVAENVQAFADAYNELMTAIDGLRENELATDSLLYSVESGLRNIMNSPAAGLPSGLAYLGDIGVSFSREGVLTVDATRLDSALNNNFSAVSELFATDGQGFANRLDSLVDGWLASDGLIDGRTDSLDDSKRLLESREESLEYRMSQVEARLFAQFSALDTLLANLQVTSDFLSQQLRQLPTYGSTNS
ncbi:MAG: flagellar filament capping protein FliD [Thiohalobacterales bacterium]|nr:flagellar filament capping protein FliD [Thiohalobacterales bacterium]